MSHQRVVSETLVCGFAVACAAALFHARWGSGSPCEGIPSLLDAGTRWPRGGAGVGGCLSSLSAHAQLIFLCGRLSLWPQLGRPAAAPPGVG